MCGIAGFCDFTKDIKEEYQNNRNILTNMGKKINHRGPDDFGIFVGNHAAFSHTRLAVIDVVGGVQPMSKKIGNRECTIVYNGELYNTPELKKILKEREYEFHTSSDTEVLLCMYLEFGEQCTKYLNGIFSFAIWDKLRQKVFLCRDRFGVKPFFYTKHGETVVFGSEIKALFEYPGVKPIIDRYGLCEIFGLGPARSPGVGVYQGVHELPPGYAAVISFEGMRLYPYWTLKADEHTDSYEETVEKTKGLLSDAIERQLVSDVPVCTLLSGGLDSSIVSAVAAKVLKKQGKTLDTYSFDFNNNSRYFKASSFQPAEDRPFVEIMIDAIKSNHTFLECSSEELYQYLFEAVLAKDLPGMTDIDSSMLYFCRQIKKNHTVCLSGECADEIFGGYPWFRDPDSYADHVFPWSKNLDVRKAVLSQNLKDILPLEEYVAAQYEQSIARVPRLSGEDKLAARQREIHYLNLTWFMTTLLDRKDRMTMASGLEVRVPFADHRLIQYIYNVPWEMRYHNQEVKGLLKDAMKDYLPMEIIDRKKSPYPKTYDPAYETALKKQLKKVLKDKNAPVCELINQTTIKEMMEGTSDYGKPWFGQLMAVPQMYAYLLQINEWLVKYHVDIQI